MEMGNVADEATIRMAEAFARGQSSDPASDARLHVEFEVLPLINQEKSEAAGMPIFDDTEFIRICRPGDKNDMVHRPVWMDKNHRASDYYRFRELYERWKQGKESTRGTPLSAMAEVGILTRSDVSSFLAVNVRTAEQFVSMADTDSQKYPGYSHLKQRVQAYLDKAREAAPAAHLKAELAERDAKLATQSEALQRQDEVLKEMAAQLAELKRNQGKRQ